MSFKFSVSKSEGGKIFQRVRKNKLWNLVGILSVGIFIEQMLHGQYFVKKKNRV